MVESFPYETKRGAKLKRAVFFCMAVLTLLAMFPQQVIAQEDGPAPPSLYSQAAVLMDADTGQVLWGKNMRQKMYPASLTKVVTCLLAMEKGNPEDVVTMTDEGVFTVPRSTTHIALTTGEQLTLEQLEYAMMVESANDAANGVAIHIGGSIEQFAGMMNKKAAQIGAAGSHFTNANGLPDNDHYTTAYDLGLFTKEALKYPEFRKLAGSQRYEIPPTNKQKDTRILNNRQYMFFLNDTYPGAFAGKTGWTEEAGKTLITIAERDGVTLICVVLKASGTVDAEFKDSTALLDYGYDHFKRSYVPKEKIPSGEISFTSSAGETVTAIPQIEQDMPVLLPDGVTADELAVSLDVKNEDYATVNLTVPGRAESFMEPVAGTFPLVLKPSGTQAAALVSSKDDEQETRAFSPLFAGILKWTGIAVGIILLALLVLRTIVSARRRRRKKRRLHAYRPYAYRPASRVVDVRLEKNSKNKIKVINREEP